jgi:putative phosphonate metabolism protein
MSYSRYAVYYLPSDPALAAFGASWLGWSVETGRAVPQPAVDGIAAVTETPRRYGFHGTLKPPFRLAAPADPAALEAAVAGLAARLAPARAEGLELARIGAFLALVPRGDASGIARVAAACVAGLDGFRAPAGPDELARRRAAGLTDRQEALLQRWGYPYVMEEFRFHLTLTGALDSAARDRVAAALAHALPALPAPFLLDAIALVGERPDGRFQLVHRYALTG